MRRLLFFALFLSSLTIGMALNQANRQRETFFSVCQLVQENFYKDDERLEQWLRSCRKQAAEVALLTPVGELMDRIQRHMNQLEVSHFLVYSPEEDRKMWQGQSVDTGIRSRYIEDHLIVTKVIEDSVASQAGVQAGDEVIAIAGADQVTPWGAQNRSGSFQFKRGEEIFARDLKAQELKIDFGPRLKPLNNKTALLEISSFRAEFFEKALWQKLAGDLNRYGHILIDLRENSGGNFVAMLRALSTFHCHGRSIGTLIQPRKEGPDKAAFDDNTNDLYQIEELDRYRSLTLQTFPEYGCYRGRVTVMVGPDTSSVAEIFAHSFFYRKDSRVWGQPTAGDVILAVWYDLPLLGRGYSISIPEAVYLTPTGEELEGMGVRPQREVFDDLEVARQGKDALIEQALRF